MFSPKPQLRLDGLKTLNDFQKLLGDINWLLPYLKLTKHDLQPLYEVLRGDIDPASPRELTPNARKTLHTVEEAIAQQTVSFIDYNRPLQYLIFNTKLSSTAVFWQQAPLMWLHLPVSLKRVLLPYYQAVSDLIIQSRRLGKCYFGKEPDVIIQPFTKDQVDWLLQTTEAWPIAIASFSGTIDNHYPPNKLVDFASCHPFIFPQNYSFTAPSWCPSVFYGWLLLRQGCLCSSRQCFYPPDRHLFCTAG